MTLTRRLRLPTLLFAVALAGLALAEVPARAGAPAAPALIPGVALLDLEVDGTRVVMTSTSTGDVRPERRIVGDRVVYALETAEGERLVLEILVRDEAFAAKEDLAAFVSACQRPLTPATDHGLILGDQGLVAERAGRLHVAAFVRANVFVALRGRVDVTNVALAIDRRLLGRLRVDTVEALARPRPTLSIPGGALRAGGTYPLGLGGTGTGTPFLRWSAPGIEIIEGEDADGSPRRGFRPTVSGRHRIEVAVATDLNLVGRARVDVLVVE